MMMMNCEKIPTKKIESEKEKNTHTNQMSMYHVFGSSSFHFSFKTKKILVRVTAAIGCDFFLIYETKIKKNLKTFNGKKIFQSSCQQ